MRGRLDDFSPVTFRRRPNRRLRPSMRLWLLGVLLVVLATVATVNYPGTVPAPETSGTAAKAPAEPQSPAAAEILGPSVITRHFQVKNGDTLYGILKEAGLTEAAILAVGSARVEGINPARLVVGRPYRLISSDDQLTEYQYEPDDETMIRVLLTEDAPAVEIVPIPYEVRKASVSGSISESLFMTIEEIGEGPSLALAIADIFAWQVDFFRDLRKGDSFRVLVEKFYRDGEMVKYGRILAAEFVNDGRKFRAFRYRVPGGRDDYYDENGDSLRKQFLKAPLRFRKISSGFTRRRLHPVTGTVKPHNGIDYAAPTGTPVMSIGDGKVIARKTGPVNGRWIKIRHNAVYSSAYLHLNSFASGIRNGSAVRQGQIIGYVGKTGRATGPHLHFAMYRNDRFIDPRKVNVPRASAVPESQKEAFTLLAEDLTAVLEQPGEYQAADNREVPDVLD